MSRNQETVFTFGADPELFLVNRNTGEPTPVCGLVGGSKMRPIPMHGMPKGFCVQEDNVMLEFNVPPTSSFSGFFENINLGMDWISQFLYNNPRTTSLYVSSACHLLFPQSKLTSNKAKEFGCAPDFDAYRDGEPNSKLPMEALKVGNSELRFAGGHIHLGYTLTNVPHFVVASLADVFIGLSCVKWDKQGPRRSMYGTAGRYRPTSYGIEYRTLSNHWLFNNDAKQTLLNGMRRLCDNLRAPLPKLCGLYEEIPWADVAKAINTEDALLASQVQDYIYTEVAEGL